MNTNVKETKTPFKQTVANYPFWDFEKESKFTGVYCETVILGDKETFQANVFVNADTGEYVYVSDSYSIRKAITNAGKELPDELKNRLIMFSIEFLGKTEINGKPFNQFNIGYCTTEQYELFYSEKQTDKKKK